MRASAARPSMSGLPPASWRSRSPLPGARGAASARATFHDLPSHGGSLPGGFFIAAVLVALAVGHVRRRYWAVLGFEALLAFQIIVTSLALVVAETLLAAAVCVVSIALGGWLFWKLVRVMGRIQAGRKRTDRRSAAIGSDSPWLRLL